MGTQRYSVSNNARQRLYELFQVALVASIPCKASQIACDTFNVLQRLCERQHRLPQRLHIVRGQYLQRKRYLM